MLYNIHFRIPKKLKKKPDYRKICNIRRTESENLNSPSLIMQLSLCIILKPGVKSRMKM